MYHCQELIEATSKDERSHSSLCDGRLAKILMSRRMYVARSRGTELLCFEGQ